MTVLAACTLLWYIPVVVVTTIVHIFIDHWRNLGMKSYITFYSAGFAIFICVLLCMRWLLRRQSLICPFYVTALGLFLLILGLSFLFWSYKTLQD